MDFIKQPFQRVPLFDNAQLKYKQNNNEWLVKIRKPYHCTF